MVSDEWPRAYVALTAGPVPGLRVVRRTDDARAEGLWGPFRRVSYLRDAVHALADVTALRDCALDDPTPGSLARPLWFPAASCAARRRAAAHAGLPARGARQLPGTVRGARRCGGVRPWRAHRPRLSRRARRRAAAARQTAHDAGRRGARSSSAPPPGATRRSGWPGCSGACRSFQASMDRLTFRYDAVGDDGTTHVYLVRRGTVRADLPLPDTDVGHAALAALTAAGLPRPRSQGRRRARCTTSTSSISWPAGSGGAPRSSRARRVLDRSLTALRSLPTAP